MKTRLVIDENTVYEVDEDCLSRRQSEGKTVCRECSEKDSKLNNRNSMNNRNRSNYNN